MTRHILCWFALIIFAAGIVTAQENWLRNRFRPASNSTKKAEPMNESAQELVKILDTYQIEVLDLFKKSAHAEWVAMTTGTDEAFKQAADAKLQYAKYHSDKETYAKIKDLRQKATGLDSLTARAAERMEQSYAQNQISPELQQKMVEMSAEIEKIFQNQRPKIDSKETTNNVLLEQIAEETDSAQRQKIWEALKQVGGDVSGKVIALAKVRNEAAKQLGFNNYWEMQVVFQDYKPEDLLAIFESLEKTTRPLFEKMKNELDGELAAKFGIPADQLMPWHYDNPFFQQAPPSKEVDPNDFYRNKTKEEIIDIAVKYYRHIGLPYEKVLAHSDMFEKEGKTQHAFSIDMDTLGDVRNACNVKPTAEWMDTVLHEGGHGVYSLGVNPKLPFNLRQECHIFTTEGVAMMFGAKARDANWMIRFADVPVRQVRAAADALKKQRIREQLIFCRWTIVMLYFEKALYENPDADLKSLWWDTVEKYQLLKRPKDKGSENPDWASKPHFVIAPVYYHNYMLGELFAAQMRASLGKRDTAAFGRRLSEKVFAPGMRYDWQEFVRRATGSPLSPNAFAEELQ